MTYSDKKSSESLPIKNKNDIEFPILAKNNKSDMWQIKKLINKIFSSSIFFRIFFIIKDRKIEISILNPKINIFLIEF